jgi:hypothetical protein
MVYYKSSISPQLCENHLRGYGSSQPYYSARAYNQYLHHGKGIGSSIAKHVIPFLRTTVWPALKETLAPVGKQFVNDIESGIPAKSALKRSYTSIKGTIKRKLIGAGRRGAGGAPKKKKRKTANRNIKKKKKKNSTKKKQKKKTTTKRKKKPERNKTDFFADI